MWLANSQTAPCTLGLFEDGTGVESGIHGGWTMQGGIPVVCEALWNWGQAFVSTLQYGFLKGLWAPPVLQVLSCFQGLPGPLLCWVFCPCLVYFSGSRVRIGVVVGLVSGTRVRNHPGCLQTSLLKMHFWKSHGAAWVGCGKSTCRSGWDFGLGAGTFLHLLRCLPLSAVTEQWKKARLSGLYFSCVCVWEGRHVGVTLVDSVSAILPEPLVF